MPKRRRQKKSLSSKEEKETRGLKKGSKERKSFIPEKIKRIMIGVSLLLVALVIILGFYDVAGKGGEWSKIGLVFLFGRVAGLVPLLFVLSALVYFRTTYENFLVPLLIAFFSIITGVAGIASSAGISFFEIETLGGFWGDIISNPLAGLVGIYATQVIFLVAIGTGALVIANLMNENFSVSEFFKELFAREYDIEPSTVKKIFITPDKEEKKEDKKKEGKKETNKKEEGVGAKREKGDPKRLIPPLELLHNGDEDPDPGDTKRNASIIKKTFSDFDISVNMGEINIGPAVTQYTLKPAEGVKLSRITSLADDLALSLAMHPVRTEAPIPGKSLVGIEVPNRKRAQITLGNLVKRKEYFETAPLTIVVGKDVSGAPVYADIAKMPHMLVAGSTGSGKTIFLNTLLVSLLYKNTPKELRLILVDPKRVEFSFYSNLPHLLTSIIYDAEKATNALQWLVGEMERRFKVLAGAGSRNITSYQEMCLKNGELERMPSIVLAVDELADLMSNKGNEIEASIVRIAQMARAVGIHLILATQRPSVEVITGLIKANVPARASFRVASQVDSRTILDTAGAEKLLGSGDMLLSSTENSKPRRIQAPFMSEEEARGIVGWLKDNIQEGEEDVLAENLEESLEKSSHKTDNFDSEEDEDTLYEDAKEIVISAEKASASLLQRRLRVGYARAARLLDILESRGVVGPAEGAKPREVYEDSQREDESPEEGGDIEDINEEDKSSWDKV